MYKIARYCSILFVLSLIIGCGKGSSLEGKVVDGKGQPIANQTMQAMRPIKEINGYQNYFTVSQPDGTFIFKNIEPMSEYWIYGHFPEEKRTNPSAAWIKIESGREGQGIILTKPIIIRFFVGKDRIITDSKTELEWYVCPEQGTTWDEAYAWVSDLMVGGGGWRMPTMSELNGLYLSEISKKIDPVFKLTEKESVWSTRLQYSQLALVFDFAKGSEGTVTRITFKFPRALAVRSRKLQ